MFLKSFCKHYLLVFKDKADFDSELITQIKLFLSKLVSEHKCFMYAIDFRNTMRVTLVNEVFWINWQILPCMTGSYFMLSESTEYSIYLVHCHANIHTDLHDIHYTSVPSTRDRSQCNTTLHFGQLNDDQNLMNFFY